MKTSKNLYLGLFFSLPIAFASFTAQAAVMAAPAQQAPAKPVALSKSNELPKPVLSPAGQKPAEALQESLPALLRTDNDIKAAQYNMKSAKAGIHTAVAAYLPSLDATITGGYETIKNPSSANTDTGYNEEDLSASQLITDFGQTTSSIGVAKQTYLKSLNTLKQTRQDVLSSGINAYTNMVRDTRSLAYAKHTEVRIVQQLQMEKTRMQKGSGYGTDLLEVQAQLSGAKARVVRARAALTNSENQYRAVFKKDPGNFLYTAMPPMPIHSLPKTLNEALKITEEMNTTLVGLREDVTISRDQLVSAKAKFAPSITANADTKRKRDVDGTLGLKREYDANVELSYPIFAGGGDLSGLRAAHYNLYSSEEKLVEAKFTTEESLRNAWENLISSKQNYEYLRRQSEQLNRFLNLAKKERKMGRRSLLDVLVADTNYIDAQTQAVAAKAEMVTAAYKLLQTMGVLNIDMVLSKENVPTYEVANAPTNQFTAARNIPVSPTKTAPAINAPQRQAAPTNGSALPQPLQSSKPQTSAKAATPPTKGKQQQSFF